MENKPVVKIGIRKMGVIMFCVTAIVIVVFLHMAYNKDINNATLIIVTAIAGLGGWHTKQQAMLDKKG